MSFERTLKFYPYANVSIQMSVSVLKARVIRKIEHKNKSENSLLGYKWRILTGCLVLLTGRK